MHSCEETGSFAGKTLDFFFFFKFVSKIQTVNDNSVFYCVDRPNKARVVLNNLRCIFFWKSQLIWKSTGAESSEEIKKTKTKQQTALHPPTLTEQTNIPSPPFWLRPQAVCQEYKNKIYREKENDVQVERDQEWLMRWTELHNHCRVVTFSSQSWCSFLLVQPAGMWTRWACCAVPHLCRPQCALPPLKQIINLPLSLQSHHSHHNLVFFSISTFELFCLRRFWLRGSVHLIHHSLLLWCELLIITLVILQLATQFKHWFEVFTFWQN